MTSCNECSHFVVCGYRIIGEMPTPLVGIGCPYFKSKVRCDFPHGVTIKPDGEYEMNPCDFKLVLRYENVTVEILECKKCGDVSIGWHRQKDTKEIEV